MEPEQATTRESTGEGGLPGDRGLLGYEPLATVPRRATTSPHCIPGAHQEPTGTVTIEPHLSSLSYHKHQGKFEEKPPFHRFFGLSWENRVLLDNLATCYSSECMTYFFSNSTFRGIATLEVEYSPRRTRSFHF